MISRLEGLNKGIRYTAYVVELILLFMVQETPGLVPPIFSARPVLIFSLAATLSLLESDLFALGFGVLAGLLMDFASGNPMGICGALAGIVFCLSSAVAKRKLHVTIGSAVLSAVVSLGLLFVLLWLFWFVFPGYSYSNVALIDEYLPTYFYTVLTMPLIYCVNLGIYHALRDISQ
jgi:hypothetical protein